MRTTVAFASQVRASRSRISLPSPLVAYRSASASPIRQPVASIQSTRSGRSIAAARSLARNSSTSRAVSAGLSARGARLSELIFALESRTGFVAMAPSCIARANMPDKQARAVFGRTRPAALGDDGQRPADHAGGHLADTELTEGRLDLFRDH